jgi:hypothetical protein
MDKVAFSVLLVVTIVGGMFKLFFSRSKNVKLKRQMLIRFSILTSIMVALLLFWITGSVETSLLYAVLGFSVLLFGSNFTMRFCTFCGSTVYRARKGILEPWKFPDNCPNCGEKLGH